jgi:hypothetical protein
LQSENVSLQARKNKLVQAGWLSDDELPPLDLSILETNPMPGI